jgi:hypothetical protein
MSLATFLKSAIAALIPGGGGLIDSASLTALSIVSKIIFFSA